MFKRISVINRSMSFLIVVFIVSFVLSATTYGAVFNVTNPTEFQDALNTAASNSGNDTINVAAGNYAITATLTYNAAQNDTLSIIGTGAGSTILDGGSSVQILNINTTGLASDDLADISISGISIKNGHSSTGEGGGLYIRTNHAKITIQNSGFSDNTAATWWSGGGAYVVSNYDTVTLSNNTR